MPTISTQMNIIRPGNSDFSGIKITETTYLSPLNNHKFQSVQTRIFHRIRLKLNGVLEIT